MQVVENIPSVNTAIPDIDITVLYWSNLRVLSEWNCGRGVVVLLMLGKKNKYIMMAAAAA